MSQSLIVASARFDGVWPWAADHFHALWQEQGDVEFIRLAGDDERRHIKDAPPRALLGFFHSAESAGVWPASTVSQNSERR